MFSRLARAKRTVAAVIVTGLAALALGGLTGCDTDLNIVTNTTLPTSSAEGLAAGTTLEEGVLTVGVNTSNTPFGGLSDSDGSSIVGLDADVAAALADELGCKLSLVDVGSDGRTAVEEGTVDVALSVTKSGKGKTVAYAGPYLNNGISLFCLASNAPASVAEVDFTDEKILVQSASAASYEIQDALGVESILSVSTIQDAFKSLEAGEATYLVANAAIGDFIARDYGDVVRVSFLSLNDITPVYAATLAGNVELTEAVTTALGEITENGTLRVITAKWLGSQGAALLPEGESLEDLPQEFTGEATVVPGTVAAGVEDTGTEDVGTDE